MLCCSHAGEWPHTKRCVCGAKLLLLCLIIIIRFFRLSVAQPQSDPSALASLASQYRQVRRSLSFQPSLICFVFPAPPHAEERLRGQHGRHLHPHLILVLRLLIHRRYYPAPAGWLPVGPRCRATASTTHVCGVTRDPSVRPIATHFL